LYLQTVGKAIGSKVHRRPVNLTPTVVCFLLLSHDLAIVVPYLLSEWALAAICCTGYPRPGDTAIPPFLHPMLLDTSVYRTGRQTGFGSGCRSLLTSDLLQIHCCWHVGHCSARCKPRTDLYAGAAAEQEGFEVRVCSKQQSKELASMSGALLLWAMLHQTKAYILSCSSSQAMGASLSKASPAHRRRAGTAEGPHLRLRW
jgi:hypothetical protein